jgi:hypothetical protein
VLISLALAAALYLLAGRLVRRGLGGARDMDSLYWVTLGSFGSILFLTGETAINEIQQLAHTMSVQDT